MNNLDKRLTTLEKAQGSANIKAALEAATDDQIRTLARMSIEDPRFAAINDYIAAHARIPVELVAEVAREQAIEA